MDGQRVIIQVGGRRVIGRRAIDEAGGGGWARRVGFAGTGPEFDLDWAFEAETRGWTELGWRSLMGLESGPEWAWEDLESDLEFGGTDGPLTTGPDLLSPREASIIGLETTDRTEWEGAADHTDCIATVDGVVEGGESVTGAETALESTEREDGEDSVVEGEDSVTGRVLASVGRKDGEHCRHRCIW